MSQDILSTLARQFLPQMTDDEKRAAFSSLQKIIDEGMFNLALNLDGEIKADISCPHCGSVYVVKRGKDQHGNQRYYCHKCGKSFTSKTKSIFATTKLDRATWMKFAQCHIDVLSLRESAERCNVSLKTAFFMRHRILEAISASVPSFRSYAGSSIELDECYLPESFSGNRNNSTCGIPRKARHRKEPKDSYEQICILTGINDAGDFFFEMTGRGAMNNVQAAEILSNKIASGSIVATDGAYAYRKALKELDVRKHVATSRRQHAINKVNNLHSQIKNFIWSFKGVTTRRLYNYLIWFKWIWSFKLNHNAQEMAELAIKQASTNTYKTTWRNYKKTPYPFFDYWEKQTKWDSTARSAFGLAC